MTTIAVAPGDRVVALSAFDEHLERRAVTGPVDGVDFIVVWVCTEEEWEQARSEGRDPRAVPWPVEDVKVVSPR